MANKLLVLGGGISGLSAAFYARHALPQLAIHVVESSARVGGWVHSTRSKDGVIFEHGPHTIRPVGDNGANTLNLIETLGIAHKVHSISREHPAAKVRMVYCNNALHTLPSSLGALFKKQDPFSRPLIQSLLHDLRAPVKRCTDDSVYQFFERRIGKDVADYAISPLIRGVCAGDARDISVKLMFRALFEAEQTHNSIFKGMFRKVLNNMFKSKLIPSVKLEKLAQKSREEKWSVYSLDGGLQSLPDALELSLKSSKVSISVSDKCENMELNPNGVEINLKSGKNIKANRIISSIPAKELGKLLGEKHPELVKMLSEHKNATVGIVNLRYKGNVLKKPAFGFLVPPSESVPLLGVVYDSTCFPNSSGDTVLTAMMGGHSFYPQFANSTPDDLYKIAVKNIAQILGIDDAPCERSVSILHECIPQYSVGHYERTEQIFKYIKQNKLPIHLIGCSYNGISLNDVIMSAKLAVSDIKM